MNNKHTATPWHCKQLIGVIERGFALFETKNRISGVTTHRIDNHGEFAQEDAEFIVRACNAHDDLVKFATDFLEVLTELGQLCECGEPDCRTTRLRAALAKEGAA